MSNVYTFSGEEQRRLGVLRRYEILDTLPEQALDDLTKLAATICEVPIALISLVDEDRQWFKAKIGFVPAETPRDLSFCDYTIRQSELMVVPDARKDERFAGNPLVTGGMGIRFYAGMPLLTPEGEALGALCVKDYVPRELTPIQVETLRVLAKQVMTHLDLSRRARELVVSERRLQLVTESARIGLVMVNQERRYEYANITYAEILNLPSPDILGQRVEDVLPTLYPQQIKSRLDRAFAGEVISYDLIKETAAGTQFYSVSYNPALVNGGVELVTVVLMDITDRKKGEMALLESTQFAQSTIDALSAEICVLDEAGTILATNQAWRQFAEASLPLAKGGETGSNYLQACETVNGSEADEVKACANGIRRVLNGERSDFSTEYACHSPVAKRWFLMRVTRFSGPGPVRVVVAHENITARKEAELASLRLAAIVASSDDAIIGKDLNGIVTSWNRGAEKVFGYPAEEMVGESILRLIPAERHAEEGHILSKIRNGESVEHFETRRLTKAGRIIDVSVTASPIKDAAGRVLGVSKVARDITDRKRKDERLRRLMNSNVQGVIFWRKSGRITEANDAFLALVGYTREDLAAGQIDWITMTPPEYAGLDESALRELEAHGACAPVEKEYFRKDGSRVPVLVGAAAFEDNPDEGVCFVLDLTERKKLEQQFLRAQRMESIGTLAGGIAHDLNNVLAPIVMSLELLQLRFPDEESQGTLALINESAQRGADMVRQVLSFARGVEGRRMELQVRHLIRDIEKIATETFLKHIQVEAKIPSELWTVLGDPTQLHQVLLNLCVNARDAMPNGGSVTFSAENLMIDEHYAGLDLAVKPGPYVMLLIEDTGTGMSPEVVEKIFDPFFTTKEIGKGTGLGLSTSLAIIKSHGGFIRVYSELGKGTRFKIYLPAQPDATGSSELKPVSEMPRGNGELILVVDDEASVRQITQQTLGAFGYRVVLAADGAEALAVYTQKGPEIAVVLTDMMMPVMDGPATIRVLRKLSPTLPIIAASGLAANGHLVGGEGVEVSHFLAKPYSADTLLKALRQVLAR
ncbi:MAG: PAS domain S-box protein [Chthoniobacteraceae bacterium]